MRTSSVLFVSGSDRLVLSIALNDDSRDALQKITGFVSPEFC